MLTEQEKKNASSTRDDETYCTVVDAISNVLHE